jgi:hypothetical protein
MKFSAATADHSVLLSFDVEEFDFALEYGQDVAEPEQFGVSAEGLVLTLDMLDRLGFTATFFCTAHFALHHEGLIRRVAARHEVASHGFYHSRFEPDDLARSRLALERVCGMPVRGYRHPRLRSLDRRLVRDAGYTYNSSENPVWLPGRYNNLRRPRVAYTEGGLLNVPISATPLIRFPLFWLTFKNVPELLMWAASAWTLWSDGYINVFFHPWEFTRMAGYKIPTVAKRLDGEALLDRLERYLVWLGRRARFVTFGEFAEARDQASSPHHGFARPSPGRGTFTDFDSEKEERGER